MKSSFAFKLALNNIGKGRKFFIPYIFASAGMMAIFYIMRSEEHTSELQSR